jgi:hypothetical protein
MDDNVNDITIDISGYDFSDDHYVTVGGNDTIDLSSINIGNISDAGTITITPGFDMNWWEDQEIVNTEREERAIRERNEGVQRAWEQYKIMVELAKTPPNFEDI